MPKVKSKRYAGQDVVLGEDLLLEFDDEGIAECPEHRAVDLARERKFRPGVFHLVEEKPKAVKPSEPKKGVSPKLAEKVAEAEKKEEKAPEKAPEEDNDSKEEKAPEKAPEEKKSSKKKSSKKTASKKATEDSSEGEKE